MSARAGELRWRWRILVLDMLYYLVEKSVRLEGIEYREARSVFAKRIEELCRDLERAG